MPEICRFLGIVVYMYFKEHNPPHFHAEYNDSRAAIDIKTLGVLEGELPPRVLSLVVEWAGQHKGEILENWEELRRTGNFKKIQPLV